MNNYAFQSHDIVKFIKNQLNFKPPFLGLEIIIFAQSAAQYQAKEP